MKSSQAPYRACVLLEEASAEAAAAKRLWFVSFIFNFPIEMPKEKKKRPLPWRALQLWQRYLLQSRNRLVLGTAWPGTAQGAVVCSFFLSLLIFSLNTGTSFKGCCRGLGFFLDALLVESWAGSSSGEWREEGEPERRPAGLRQSAGHKDARHVLLLRQRSLSFPPWWVLHQWEDLVLQTEIKPL